MSYSYYDKDNNIKKLDIQVGMKWDDIKTDNEKLNSIFGSVDDGDGYVQFAEKVFVDKFLSQIDSQESETANNNVLENEEFEKFDPKKAKLYQVLTSEDFSPEKIKQYFPADKFKITQDKNGIKVTDKSTGKVVLTSENTKDGTVSIKEYNHNGKKYTASEWHGELSVVLKDKTNMTERTYGYTDGKVSHIVDNDFRLGNLSQVESKKAEKPAKAVVEEAAPQMNPDEWNSEKGIEKLEAMTDEKLLAALDQYQDENNELYTLQEMLLGIGEPKEKVYLLDEISKNKDIPEATRKTFVENAMKHLEKQVGYDPDFERKDHRMTSKYYTSDNTYSVKFKDDIVTITKNPKEGTKEDPVKRTLDLKKLLKDVQLDVQPAIKKAIQEMPPELIMSLAIECDSFLPVCNEFGIEGGYVAEEDRMKVGYGSIKRVRPEAIVHELGHAIDNAALSNVSILRSKVAVSDGKQTRTVIHQTVSNDELRRNHKISHDDQYIRDYDYALFKFLKMEQYLKNPGKKNQELDMKKLADDGYYDRDKHQWTKEFTKLVKDAYMYADYHRSEGASEGLVLATYGESTVTSGVAVSDDFMKSYVDLYKATINLKDSKRHTPQK